MELDWTERHRPRTLDDVYGQPKAVEELRKWADGWARGSEKKSLVLDGPTGVGKTSAALALARERGWAIVEMNASDMRNAEAVRDIAERGSQFDTFMDDGSFVSAKMGGFKLIVIDEAEHLFGREDAGGGGAIMGMLRKTRQPIILIVNDFYELQRKYSGIAHVTEHIRFQRIQKGTVAKALRRIAEAEGLSADDAAVDIIAENSDGDLRSAVKDLQAMGVGVSELHEHDLVALSYRERTLSVFDLLGSVFRDRDSARNHSIMRLVEEDPESLLLWFDENLPRQYPSAEDRARGFDALAKADIYLARVSKRQNYALWSYATDMMTDGVAFAKSGPRSSGAKLEFPQWLRSMSRTKDDRRLKRELCGKLARHLHASTAYVEAEYFEHFRTLMASSTQLQIGMARELALTEDELALLLGKKGSAHIKRILEEASRMDGREKAPAQTMKGFEKAEEEKPPAKPDADEPKQQKSLFEF